MVPRNWSTIFRSNLCHVGAILPHIADVIHSYMLILYHVTGSTVCFHPLGPIFPPCTCPFHISAHRESFRQIWVPQWVTLFWAIFSSLRVICAPCRAPHSLLFSCHRVLFCGLSLVFSTAFTPFRTLKWTKLPLQSTPLPPLLVFKNAPNLLIKQHKTGQSTGSYRSIDLEDTRGKIKKG